MEWKFIGHPRDTALKPVSVMVHVSLSNLKAAAAVKGPSMQGRVVEDMTSVGMDGYS